MDTHEIQQKLSGTFIPISTPFLENEEIDHEALRLNLQHYAQTELKGYLALGSNGENKSLTEDEKIGVLRAILKRKAPQQIVIAGAAYEAQREAKQFFRHAGDLGADFGLLLSPSYFKKQMTDDEELPDQGRDSSK